MCVCTFLQSLTVPFQARNTLSAENAELHAQLEEAHTLQQYLDVIRGHTIGFILEQLNTLHIGVTIIVILSPWPVQHNYKYHVFHIFELHCNYSSFDSHKSHYFASLRSLDFHPQM